MRLFLQSAFRYFNKWGWVFDRQRRAANRRAIAALHAFTKSR
jgi:hypothetical protein